jgi:hypothetical protein
MLRVERGGFRGHIRFEKRGEDAAAKSRFGKTTFPGTLHTFGALEAHVSRCFCRRLMHTLHFLCSHDNEHNLSIALPSYKFLFQAVQEQQEAMRVSGNEEQHRIASEATMERMRTQMAKQHTELKTANKDVELFEVCSNPRLCVAFLCGTLHFWVLLPFAVIPLIFCVKVRARTHYHKIQTTTLTSDNIAGQTRAFGSHDGCAPPTLLGRDRSGTIQAQAQALIS